MAQLTTAQAAQLLGVAEATLHNWRCHNEGPADTRTGRLIRYPDYEIARWIRDRTIETSHRNGAQKEEREMGNGNTDSGSKAGSTLGSPI